MKSRHLELLQNFDSLPPSAVLPLAVAAAHQGISEKTARRLYPLVDVSDGRVGIRKGDLGQPREVRRRGPRKAQTSVKAV
jgi:hypothetical protein